MSAALPFMSPLGFLNRLARYHTTGRKGEVTDSARAGHALLEVRNPAMVPGGFMAEAARRVLPEPSSLRDCVPCVTAESGASRLASTSSVSLLK